MSRTVRGILKCAYQIVLALALLLSFYPQQTADACTRVLWRTAENRLGDFTRREKSPKPFFERCGQDCGIISANP